METLSISDDTMDILLDRVNDNLPAGKSISRSTLYRCIKYGTSDNEIRSAVVKVLGRAAGACYDWCTACESAEKQNNELREMITQMNYNQVFAFHRLTPRIVGMWITFLVIFLSLIYGRPGLNNLALTRTDSIIAHTCEVEAENAILQAQAEVMNDRLEKLVEYVEDLEAQIQGMDGEIEEVEDEQ
ncbi:MAG: hypothetical protein JW885_02690 [Deltaproteobacteria bacterium]|nr:hypothetical protein [Candidatus Zymogenaceae bacterium]